MEPTITLPLSALRSLLFGESGDNNLPLTKPQSTSPGDIAKVVITHKAIGVVIKEIDTQEAFFHVELLNAHSEIWLTFEWKESNARRERIKQYHKEHNDELLKKAEIIESLVDELSVTRLPKDHCNTIAEQIYMLYKTNQYQKVVKILDSQVGCELENTLKKYL